MKMVIYEILMPTGVASSHYRLATNPNPEHGWVFRSVSEKFGQYKSKRSSFSHAGI